MTNYTSERINEWNKTAAITIAKHGANNGNFKSEIWANGKTMVSPANETSTPFNCVAIEVFRQIENAGWKVYAN